MNVYEPELLDSINLPVEALDGFCKKWRILKVEVFGSVPRDDFGPDSDVDFLVTFDAEARWSLMDIVGIEHELGDLVGRPVDLVEREAVEQSENWIRRKAILESVRPIYVA